MSSDQSVVIPYVLTEQYSDTDAKFIRTFKLEDDAYTFDSKHVFDELKPLSIDGPGWT